MTVPNQAENHNQLRPNTHSFDVDIAEEYGIEIAIMYKHITYWVNYNKKLNTNFHDGYYWFYNTLKEIAAHFPYWSHKQVERIINKMFDLKLILKGNYNQNKYDQTCWYTINCPIDFPKSGNGNHEIGKPIPNTNTNTKDIKEIYKEKDATNVAGAKAPPPKYEIKLSKEEEETLLKLMSQDDLKYWKDQLLTHLMAVGKPNKYKSHYAVIRNWFNADQKKKTTYNKKENKQSFDINNILKKDKKNYEESMQSIYALQVIADGIKKNDEYYIKMYNKCSQKEKEEIDKLCKE